MEVKSPDTEETREFYNIEIRIEAYQGLLKLISNMKEVIFVKHFNKIFEHIWCLIKHA